MNDPKTNGVISRSELIKQIRLMASRTSLGETRPDDISGIEVCGLILNAPALDAVPVIRCRECKHRCTLVCPMYHTETCLDDLDGFDDYNVDRTDNDGFCHLGARMDGEAE